MTRARSESGRGRPLVRGSPVYRGDTVETARGAFAVLAFRDDTRVTVSEVAVIDAEPEPLSDAPGFSARCRWSLRPARARKAAMRSAR